ncbi:hypothetical protein SESBI_14540 [Sesbania bispinosa]|nr:hypothetical protein SESBI_49725 [Sesbania bispinosa]KAJ1420102.1 hypothetical protein SESBI_14540 [Sesbania bispinosa]
MGKPSTKYRYPIWLAAQRAVARYEGILSPVGPRERLLRRMLSWIGLIPPTPETPFEADNDNHSPEPYLRFAPQNNTSIVVC